MMGLPANGRIAAEAGRLLIGVLAAAAIGHAAASWWERRNAAEVEEMATAHMVVLREAAAVRAAADFAARALDQSPPGVATLADWSDARLWMFASSLTWVGAEADPRLFASDAVRRVTVVSPDAVDFEIVVSRQTCQDLHFRRGGAFLDDRLSVRHRGFLLQPEAGADMGATRRAVFPHCERNSGEWGSAVPLVLRVRRAV